MGVSDTYPRMEILVSPEDQDLIQNHKWYISDFAVNSGHTCHYAYRHPDGRKYRRYLHRDIMMRINGKDICRTHVVDHIDHNGLNNRRENLRVLTRSENVFHQRLRHDNSAGIRGIYWNKQKKKWTAYIGWNKKQIIIGHFQEREHAVVARCAVEKVLYKNISEKDADQLFKERINGKNP